MELRSKLDQFENEISVKDEQIRQIKAQIQDRNDRISKLEKEITEFSNSRSENRELVQSQTSVLQNIRETQSATKVQYSNSEINQKYNHALVLFNSRNYQDAIDELTLSSCIPVNKLFCIAKSNRFASVTILYANSESTKLYSASFFWFVLNNSSISFALECPVDSIIFDFPNNFFAAVFNL